jgi:hypothetical protein
MYWTTILRFSTVELKSHGAAQNAAPFFWRPFAAASGNSLTRQNASGAAPELIPAPLRSYSGGAANE